MRSMNKKRLKTLLGYKDEQKQKFIGSKCWAVHGWQGVDVHVIKRFTPQQVRFEDGVMKYQNTCYMSEEDAEEKYFRNIVEFANIHGVDLIPFSIKLQKIIEDNLEYFI